MLKKETMLQLVKQMSNVEQIDMEMLFSEIGMDSTQVIELLIELEIMFNIDLLDERLNFDEMVRVVDIFDYINHVLNERGK